MAFPESAACLSRSFLEPIILEPGWAARQLLKLYFITLNPHQTLHPFLFYIYKTKPVNLFLLTDLFTNFVF